jgi:adenosine kinase
MLIIRRNTLCYCALRGLMGAIKIETAGTQNHSFTLAEFKERYHENFGHSF